MLVLEFFVQQPSTNRCSILGFPNPRIEMGRYSIARRLNIQCGMVAKLKFAMQGTELASHYHKPLALFEELFGAGKDHVFRAPARINILGEHVDYVSYLPTASLPFGSHEHEMVMVYRRNEAGIVRGASTNNQFPPFTFDLSEGEPQPHQTWLEYLYDRPTPNPHWGNYVKGAVFFALHKTMLKRRHGFDFVIGSSIPPQGGSSSSSALTVLAGAAFREINDIPFSPAELAQDSAQAEWYVGTRGGALDHTTICLAERHHAVHVQYAQHQTSLVPLPENGYKWITFFSHPADKGREVMLAYNERAAVSRLLIPAFLRRHSEWKQEGLSPDLAATLIKELPDAIHPAEIRHQFPEVYEECRRAFPALIQERNHEPLKLHKRALHHLGEVKRISQAVTYLKNSNDAHSSMRFLGELLNATHESLRDLYEISTPLVNQLHEILMQDTNVLGARLIGGGFGGNVLALTTEDHVESLLQHVQAKFYAPQNRDAVAEGAIMVSTPGNGVSRLY